MKIHIIFISILFFLYGCSDKTADISSSGVWIDINRLPHHGPYYLINGNLYLCEFYLNKDEDHSHILDTIMENVPPLDIEGVDMSSFKFLLTYDDVYYAKDKNHVYYPPNIWLIEGFTCIEGYAEKLYTQKAADPQTFKYIGDGYAVDKKNMYREGSIIRWNDSILNKFKSTPK